MAPVVAVSSGAAAEEKGVVEPLDDVAMLPSVSYAPPADVPSVMLQAVLLPPPSADAVPSSVSGAPQAVSRRHIPASKVLQRRKIVFLNFTLSLVVPIAKTD